MKSALADRSRRSISTSRAHPTSSGANQPATSLCTIGSEWHFGSSSCAVCNQDFAEGDGVGEHYWPAPPMRQAEEEQRHQKDEAELPSDCLPGQCTSAVAHGAQDRRSSWSTPGAGSCIHAHGAGSREPERKVQQELDEVSALQIPPSVVMYCSTAPTLRVPNEFASRFPAQDAGE